MLDCSLPAGGPGHTGRTAPRRSHSRTEVGCGDISAPNLGRHDVGVSPLADRRSKVPAHGRETSGGAGPPSGCSRGRVGDSCARSIPEPAPARLPPPSRAAPSNPHRSRATPPAALSANTALVCTGAPGHRDWESAAGRGFPGAPRPPPPAPAARPPRAQEFQAQRMESVPPPPLRLWGGGRSQAPTGARAPGLCSLGPLSLPGLESDPRELGIPRAPGVGPRSCRFLCLPSLPLRAGDRVLVRELGCWPEFRTPAS